MDDTEAKFLIDQFNKYASWAFRPSELFYSLFAVLVAVAVLITTLPPSSPEARSGAVVFFMACIFILGWYMHSSYRKDHTDVAARLLFLDTYRRNSSLPDGLDLAAVVGSNAKDLPELVKKLLVEEASKKKITARSIM